MSKGLILILASIIIVISVFIILKVLEKKRKNKTDQNKKQSYVVNLIQPSFNMKSRYLIDFTVFFTNNSKEVLTLFDRFSPTVKIDMSNASFIIKYETYGPSNNILKQTDNKSKSDCICPGDNKDIINDSNIENNSSENIDKSDNKGTMIFTTPSFLFQRYNKLEIIQDLRYIDINLNNEPFFSALLDNVPYLYGGNAVVLPDGGDRSIEIKKFEFKNN